MRHASGALRAVRGWRPGLRTWVLGASALVVIGLAFPISGSAADQLRESSRQAAQDNAESIVRSYVDPIVDAPDLDLSAPPNPTVQEQLSRLEAGREITRVNVWTRDGRILYSTEPELRNRRFDIDQDLAQAFAGTTSAEFEDAEEHGSDRSGLPGRNLTLATRK